MTGIGVGLALLAGGFGGWPGVAATAVVAVALARTRIALIVVVVALAALAAWRVSTVDPPRLPETLIAEPGWTMVVASFPMTRERGLSFDAVIRDADGREWSVWVISRGSTDVTYGDTIYGEGTLEDRHDIQPGFAGYLRGRGASGSAYLSWHTVAMPGSGLFHGVDGARQAAAHALRDAVPGDAGALLAGLVVGDDGRLSAGADDEFRRAGLSHLTAISGSNLAFVVGIVLAAGAFAGGRVRTAFLFLAAGSAWGYALFVGLMPPAMRSALAVTGMAGGRIAGRTPDLVTLTLLAGGAQVLVRPRDAMSISFQLSLAASMGLAIALGRYPRPTRRGMLLDLLAATVVAQIATLPIIAGGFGQLSITAIAANVLAGPVVAIAFPLGIVAALLLPVVPPLGEGFAALAGLFADLVLAIAHVFGAPWAQVTLPELGDAGTSALFVLAFLVLLVAGSERRLLLAKIRRVQPARHAGH